MSTNSAPKSQLFYEIVLCLFLLTLASGLTFAQDRGLDVIAREVVGSTNYQVGKQYAVIIGIDRYQSWLPLKSAVSEAKNIKRVLADYYYFDEFIELYDADATAVNIRKLFTQTLPAKLDIHDSLLVFYAGHGQLDESKSGFWIPVDGGTDALAQDRWLPNSQLRNYLGQLKAQRVLVMADSCFSGDLLNTSRGASPVIDSAYYKRALQMTARQVLSSGASETVPDESEFGRQVLSYLERNTEPLIDSLSIFERIRGGMTQTLPMFGSLPGNENGASYVFFRKQRESVTQPKLSSQPVATAPLVTLHVSAGSVYEAWAVPFDQPDALPFTVTDGSQLPMGTWFIHARLPGDVQASWNKKLLLASASDISLTIPALSYSVAFKVNELQGQRQILEEQRNLMQPARKRWKTASTIGWATAGVGTAVSVISYFVAGQARGTYDAATTASSASAARSMVESSNTLFQAGVLGGSAGILTGLLALILTPDSNPIERDIIEFDQKIQALEGQK